VLTDDYEIHGFVAPGMEAVRETFAQNFTVDGGTRELGASFCVYSKGECVVDLWGGHTDKSRSRAWQRDTTINVYSSTKALTALCVAMLVDRGLLRYSDKVAKHWPEFGTNGKEDTTISQLMSHQSGNPCIEETTKIDELLDWDLIISRLENQAPVWKPGTATGYHAWTVGFLAGEIVRRVTGKSIGQFFYEYVASVLSAEAYIGLPLSKDKHAATLYGPGVPAPITVETPPDWVVRTMENPPFDPEKHNLREWRAAELPSFGGFASANGLATVYAALAENGKLNGLQIISTEALDEMTKIRSDRVDGVIGMSVPWAAGVTLNTLDLYGPNAEAFGHAGWGGSVVIADRASRVSLGYVCNQMSQESFGDARATALIHKV